MAKVTIVLEDQQDGGVAVNVSHDPPLTEDQLAEKEPLTDAQESARWIIQDIQDGEQFMEMLARVNSEES